MRPGRLSPPAERTAGERNPSQTRSRTMAFIKTIFTSLLLSLVLAGGALAGERININTADVDTIDRVLVNVGPAKAEAIVAYRKKNGAFKSAEQLAMVKGIGLKTVEKNRNRLSFGRSEEHTSELQSLMRISYAVFCLKKKQIHTPITSSQL